MQHYSAVVYFQEEDVNYTISMHARIFKLIFIDYFHFNLKCYLY